MNTTCEESKCDRDVFARKREDIIGEQPEENSLKELEALQKFIPFTPSETSKGRGWNGMQAARYSRIPTGGELSLPPVSLHSILLHLRSPEKFNLQIEELKRDTQVFLSL